MGIRVEFGSTGAEDAAVLQAKIDAVAVLVRAGVKGFHVARPEGKADVHAFLARDGARLAHEMEDKGRGRAHGDALSIHYIR
jgi:hypothetical protein